MTEDLSDITDAKFLTGKGKKTPLLARISTTAGERGAADTVRDIRGWSMKLFTEEGNQDFVFNSLPVFFIRDPIKFPSVNRSHKRHPVTNVPDPDMFWDYHVNNQEGIHALMHLFGMRGIPASVRIASPAISPPKAPSSVTSTPSASTPTSSASKTGPSST